MTDRVLILITTRIADAERFEAALRAHGGELAWQVHHATTAVRGVSLLAAERCDAVVVERVLPDGDGLSVLRHLRAEHPEAARFLLAQTPADLRLAFDGAQHVIDGGAPETELGSTLARACRLNDVLRAPKLRAVVGSLAALPSAPRIYWELQHVSARPTVSRAEVAAVLAKDPAMCAKLLQLSNKAFFGVTKRVTTVVDAVALLGMDQLKALALSTHAFAMFERPCAGFSLDEFQLYSTRVARLARQLVEPGAFAEEAFTAAIVHDLGELILASRLPEQFAAIRRRVIETGTPNYEVEREVLGIAHPEVGAYLLASWGVPFSVVEAVAYHHTPRAAGPGDRPVLAALHIAATLIGIAVGEPYRLDVAFFAEAGGGLVPDWRSLAERSAVQP